MLVILAHRTAAFIVTLSDGALTRHVHQTLAVLSREGESESWYRLEEVNAARLVEIERGHLRELMENTHNQHRRVPLGFAASSPAWAERFVVPAALNRPDGRDASSVLDCFKHALLGSYHAIVEGLLAEVHHRVRAMDAFLAKHATEESLQKARLWRLMRS